MSNATNSAQPADGPSPEKPTEDWVTGDEPMTGPQRSYLETLSREAGEELDTSLTKAQASDEIDRLQRVTGRTPADDDHDATESAAAVTAGGEPVGASDDGAPYVEGPNSA